MTSPPGSKAAQHFATFMGKLVSNQSILKIETNSSMQWRGSSWCQRTSSAHHLWGIHPPHRQQQQLLHEQLHTSSENRLKTQSLKLSIYLSSTTTWREAARPTRSNWSFCLTGCKLTSFSGGLCHPPACPFYTSQLIHLGLHLYFHIFQHCPARRRNHLGSWRLASAWYWEHFEKSLSAVQKC